MNSGDLITLYYVNNRNWVNLATVVTLDHCPRSAPPASTKYDICSHEVLKSTFIISVCQTSMIADKVGIRNSEYSVVVPSIEFTSNYY